MKVASRDAGKHRTEPLQMGPLKHGGLPGRHRRFDAQPFHAHLDLKTPAGRIALGILRSHLRVARIADYHRWGIFVTQQTVWRHRPLD